MSGKGMSREEIIEAARLYGEDHRAKGFLPQPLNHIAWIVKNGSCAEEGFLERVFEAYQDGYYAGDVLLPSYPHK